MKIDLLFTPTYQGAIKEGMKSAASALQGKIQQFEDVVSGLLRKNTDDMFRFKNNDNEAHFKGYEFYVQKNVLESGVNTGAHFALSGMSEKERSKAKSNCIGFDLETPERNMKILLSKNPVLQTEYDKIKDRSNFDSFNSMMKKMVFGLALLGSVVAATPAFGNAFDKYMNNFAYNSSNVASATIEMEHSFPGIQGLEYEIAKETTTKQAILEKLSAYENINASVSDYVLESILVYNPDGLVDVDKTIDKAEKIFTAKIEDKSVSIFPSEAPVLAAAVQEVLYDNPDKSYLKALDSIAGSLAKGDNSILPEIYKIAEKEPDLKKLIDVFGMIPPQKENMKQAASSFLNKLFADAGNKVTEKVNDGLNR